MKRAYYNWSIDSGTGADVMAVTITHPTGKSVTLQDEEARVFFDRIEQNANGESSQDIMAEYEPLMS